tara:strand:- start:4734 stop:4979 length:246 start_codon:yes stop_codon:yes gene_type:complete
MNDFIQKVFGPLDKRFCDWFFILSVLGFVMLLILVISTVIVGFKNGKGIDFYLQSVSIALGYGIFYFQNRLLHSMCAASLN